MRFTKMQGLGNDFVVIDGPLDLDRVQTEAICDRRFGVGADGVLVVTAGNPIGMEYWNADGSPAEMCGNGLRCVARYAFDRGLVEAPEFVVDTPLGPRRVNVRSDEVEVELGETRVTGHVSIDDAQYHLIDVGNPHAVTIVGDPDTAPVSEIGPRVETDPQFVDGTNVEFIAVRDGRVSMRVWERGVGETRACGTGMVAAAMVASKAMGLTGVIPITAPGGEARVEFRDGVSWLTGPAEYSFTGELDLTDSA